MKLKNWLLVEVALLLIGLTKISLIRFQPPVCNRIASQAAVPLNEASPWYIVTYRAEKPNQHTNYRYGIHEVTRAKPNLRVYIRAKPVVACTIPNLPTSIVDPDPGSEIRCFFDPWIRDEKKSGSGINILDHIFKN